jgi:hypothetical protein
MSAYDDSVAADSPKLYIASFSTTDASGTGKVITSHGSPTSTTLPNGDTAHQFPNGPSKGTIGHYLSVADDPDFSVVKGVGTGAITLECWVRFDALAQPNADSDKAVNWFNKVDNKQYEWEWRYYGTGHDTSDGNPVGSTCCYVFNLVGGYGSGWDDNTGQTTGQWVHYAGTINTAASKQYPNGYVKIYRNGVLKNTNTLSAESWGKPTTYPGNGTAPVRIGFESDDQSYFYGAVGKAAIYSTELSASRIQAHYSAMSAAPPPSSSPPPSSAPPPTSYQLALSGGGSLTVTVAGDGSLHV